ncbi:pyridoxamine 5'-phosphate oxidase family protein [Antrihabitans sp. YC2-6]|uniref:pyridoxamine 5'-phosphate oxidase family protein n=1 Tax=Antrihabitans sp. YC2-6 TaxID=2799498 RepID=UPI0018F7B930|nr:pyridoxamine 5'-phosphate oxidase family protein [Antrihabitans sp. YC2-6]MBJ8348989.1 pyridoxamine 5'-phosphate oxidase family protein [Antrihabitans sp. YC2-6]
MATWKQFDDEAPELASAIRARLEAHKHHILATLRKDGSPRVSGTEVEIFEGLLVLGSMPGARKVEDLRRDPRYGLHSNPGHHTMEGGDAKVSGRARELEGAEKQAILACYPENPGESAQMFALDLDEAVLTTVDGEHLYVDHWRPGQPVKRTTR